MEALVRPESLTPNIAEEMVVERLSTTFERALAAAETLAEKKEVRDRAEAFRVYFAARAGYHDAQNAAAYWKIRTEREMGVLLDPVGPGRPPKSSQSARILPEGINYSQSSRWQQLAGIDERLFEQYAAETRERGEEVTAAGLLRFARTIGMARKRADRPASAAAGPLPAGRFSLIYADPPWRYESLQTQTRSADQHYRTMALEEICALPVSEMAANDCALFLWTTSPCLLMAFRVIAAWGFEYKTGAVWIKDGFGMGFYFRQNHEHLLLATRGTPGAPDTDRRPDSVIHSPKGAHSAKPTVTYAMMETMYPGATRVELFARQAREGWSAWGNELQEQE